MFPAQLDAAAKSWELRGDYSPKSSKGSAEDVDQSSPAIMIIGMESSL
jgi:hypothetical protein